MIELGSALDKVVDNAASSYGTDTNAELHGHSLFHGKDDWISLQNMHRARIDIYAKAFQAIAANPDVQIVIRGVDIQQLKRRYTHPYDIHAITLAQVCERLDWIAQDKSEYVLTIADQVEKAANYRQLLWELQRSPVEGYTFTKLTRLVDTLHFVPSSSSRYVQAIDLILYLYARMHSKVERDERAKQANKKLWDIITGKLTKNSGLWSP